MLSTRPRLCRRWMLAMRCLELSSNKLCSSWFLRPASGLPPSAGWSAEDCTAPLGAAYDTCAALEGCFMPPRCRRDSMERTEPRRRVNTSLTAASLQPAWLAAQAASADCL